jgi:acylglycerol lipase
MTVVVNGHLVSRDGTRLFWQAWVPASPRAALALVHGLAEHSGRYDHIGRHLAARGLATYALDYRGHGKSGGRRVHVASFDEYVEDVLGLLALVGERHPPLPRFLMGHSQGGLIALLCVLRHPQGIRGAIVSAPLVAAHPAVQPAWPMRAAAAVLLRLAPAFLVANPVDSRILSHDRAVGEAYDRDPLVSHRVSSAWFAAMGRAQAEVRRRAAELAVPALVMSSGDDRLVDPDAVDAWARTAPAGRVDHARWDGLYHEMLNEPPPLVTPVFARIDQWLDAQLR